MQPKTPDIGSRIRRAREQRGLTIRDMASTTKISPPALNAIECNDFERLPGGVFRRAYLRAVAAEVGLDPEELVREYRATFETAEPGVLPPPRTIESFDRVRVFARWPTVLLLIGLVFAASLILTRPEVGDLSPTEPPTLNPVEVRGFDSGDAADDVALTANAAVTEPGAPSVRLEIQFHGLCWVSAVADGERLVYRLMRPGEETVLEAQKFIVLRVGDAGAVTYSVNGAAGQPLGRSGEAVTIRIGRGVDASRL
jgi:cytoskeletal protein RodZ